MENRAFVPSYFAGSFTGMGFNNFMPEALVGVKKVYIIKGTPGSGKSTLMKKIASAVEASGEKAERIYCSSDPDSLDGVVVPSMSFAIVDGTAPHVMETSYPLAVETIVNTGDYISAEKIENRREEIITLSDSKKRLFEQAGLLLRSAHALNRLKMQICEEGYSAEKGFKFCMNVLQKEKSYKAEGTVIRRSCASFGKNGLALLNSFPDAEKIYSVCKEFSPFVLGTLRLLAEEHKLSAIYSPSPFNVSDVACVYLPESKRLFISSELNDNGERITLCRFEQKGAMMQRREKLKFISKTEALILSEARTYLSEAMEKHRELEKIYVSALNKDGLDCLASSIVLSLLGDK